MDCDIYRNRHETIFKEKTKNGVFSVFLRAGKQVLMKLPSSGVIKQVSDKWKWKIHVDSMGLTGHYGNPG